MPHFLNCNCIVCCLLWKIDSLIIEVKYPTMCLSEYTGQTVPEPVESNYHCGNLFVQQNLL